MRNLLPGLAVALLLSIACNNNKKSGDVTSTSDSNEKVTNASDAENIAKNAGQTNDKVEELKKLTPLSPDQLKALVPEELMGMKRSNISANSAMGTAVCNATYETDDGKELKVSIFDCAGEAGAGVYSIRYSALLNFQQENDNGYQKAVDFNDGKAIEKYSKGNDEYNLTYMSGDRFLVSIEGKKTGLDMVKEAAKTLIVKVN